MSNINWTWGMPDINGHGVCQILMGMAYVRY
jgi:hypothetical protein